VKSAHLYLLHVWGDVEPSLQGPYDTEEERDHDAQHLRFVEGEDCGGLYPLTLEVELENMLDGIQHKLEVDTYSGGFFEDDHCDTCGAPPGEVHPSACADAIEREAASHE
jgi:hypothetical protein